MDEIFEETAEKVLNEPDEESHPDPALSDEQPVVVVSIPIPAVEEIIAESIHYEPHKDSLNQPEAARELIQETLVTAPVTESVSAPIDLSTAIDIGSSSAPHIQNVERKSYYDNPTCQGRRRCHHG